METSALRVLERCWVALLAALAPEQAAAANDTLRMMADCVGTPLAEAIAYRQLAYSAEPG